MGDRGRFVIPAELRDRAGFQPGATLILLETPEGVLMLTREQLLARVRRELAGKDLVGELLRERRAAADREDRE
ncbi:MAG: AbrB/MazE/SpoVT family DNA-binding domain-containing protein [Candidatus Dormibacteraceae bacterium]